MTIKRLGLTINSFDSVELLEPSILQIRNQVDWICALYQKKSYWGNPIDPIDMDEMQRLKKIGLIDELYEFKPDFSKYSREQECDKRNISIDLAKERGCSHYLNTDCDEVYDTQEFIKAKELINKNGWTSSYCSYINYYRDLDHYLVYPFKPFVPFITSVYFKFRYNGPSPGPSDPTRRIDNPLGLGQYVFPNEIVRMGHLCWIRKDIRKKLVNWSAKNHFPKELIDKAVERYENWKENESAVMLFNVPENQVVVKKLDKRLICINIPWLEEQTKQWKEKNNYL